MIQNYFKIAWRNLVSGGRYSLLNIGGLGFVLAVSSLLFWWVKNELTYDNFHSDIEGIYRVNTQFGSETAEDTFLDTPGAVSTAALKSIPGLMAAVRIAPYSSETFKIGEKTFKEKSELVYVDEQFLKVFDGFLLLYGNKNNPFPSQNSVIVTKDLAVKFFGSPNAVGKVFKSIESNRLLTVGAVIDQIPENSYFKQKMFLPMRAKKESFKKENNGDDFNDNWNSYDFETFVKLDKNADSKLVGEKLTFIKNKIRNRDKDNATFFLQRFHQINLYSPDGKNPGLQQVRLLGLIAVLLLSIGCINYVNLTTARASRRNKEVGVRKIVGAKASQLAKQLMVESFLTLGFSLLLALLLIQALLPFYHGVTGKTAHFSIFELDTLLLLFGTLVITFLLAGIYPALMIAGFNPIHVLRGNSNQRVTSVLRKGLVIIQFSLTGILITGTLIIGSQLRFIRERDPGFNREHVFTFDAKKFAAPMKEALSTEPSVRSVNTASDIPLDISSGTATVEWDGKNPAFMPVFAYMSIDHHFIPNFGIKIMEGRNFNGGLADSAHFMLNEAAIKQMNLKDPIGKRIKVEEAEGDIIGVVKDFNIASIHETIRPLILSSQIKDNNIVLIKTTGASAKTALAVASEQWKKYAPEYPFDYKFLDDHYNDQYKADQKTEYLFNFFAGTAIVISCLGLLGLVSFTAEQRTKEIGIRKVLGASVVSITSMLSKEFLKLILISIVIAIPVAWYFMEKWLDNFAFKVTMDWKPFLLGSLLTIVTAIFTISFQSINTALTNPVDSLKRD